MYISKKWILFLLLLVLSLQSCTLFKPRPARVTFNFEVQASVNPDVDNRPSPVVFRIYELRNELLFNQKDFFALYNADEDNLGDTFIARHELLLNPGEVQSKTLQLNLETQFVGLLAAFRDQDKATWRQILSLASIKKIAHRVRGRYLIEINLNENQIAVDRKLTP